MSSIYKFIASEAVRLDESSYSKYKKVFLDNFLNTLVDGSYIRVPLIGRYLQFHALSFDDYNIVIDNNLNLISDKNRFYVYSEVDIRLHFRDFLKEYGRRDSGLHNLFSEDYLLPVADTSLYHYQPLTIQEFSSLLTVKTHLKNRLKARPQILKDVKDLSWDIQFMIPKFEYAMNKNILKIIIEFSFS